MAEVKPSIYENFDEFSGVHLNSDQKLGELMLASEDHASHDTWTKEASKICELMLAFSAAIFRKRAQWVSVVSPQMEHPGPSSSRLQPRTEGHPQHDTDKILGAILSKIPVAPCFASRHRVCASTVRPTFPARSVHLDCPRSRLGPRFDDLLVKSLVDP